MIIRRRTLLVGAAALALAPRANPQGVDAFTVGGAGGRIIRVITLRPDGPGSITEAIKARGKRIVVFEVGGVIDLNMKTLRIDEPNITIAGQTAPAPGITFIRGGISLRGPDALIQHIAVRPGEAGQAKKSGWECDGISAYAADSIVVENCSITWATDEGLSASGPRFGVGEKGATAADWRDGTSSNILFRRNIVAEGLSNSTHSKGEHSKGSLFHDNVRNAVIEQSLYAHNMERNILFKGGAQGVMNRCVVYNPGKRFAHYNLHENEWGDHPWQQGDLTITGNIFMAGPSTDPKAAAFMLGGEGDLRLAMANNHAVDAKGARLAEFGTFGSKKAKVVDRPDITPVDLIPEMIDTLAACGARPWDRDPIDARIVADVKNGTGKIIDSEQDVGGYPVRPETRAAFKEVEWNLETMERKA
ncbi:MAG: pectate lyase [Hyphomonadaceae bacterium]|nr:pectate lyase [Hyphomonadaceae bacterium]